jgi:uncharacterized protein YcgL (UPF0745 family)
MKAVGFTISGNRYEVKLDEDFANFVVEDLKNSGFHLQADNSPDRLIQAYLKLAKQACNYESEIEMLIETLDSI